MSVVRYRRNQFPAFNALVDNFFGSELFDNRISGSVPAVNIRESSEGFFVELAAPGLSKEDFQIEVDGKLLRISSQKKNEHSEEKTSEENPGFKYFRKEFSYQSFQRSFSLPDTVDGEKIAASYENGVLTLSIPKREEAKVKGPRLINIG
jgi:HSP20 family protein